MFDLSTAADQNCGMSSKSSVAHGQVVESRFRPHPLIPNPHAQTILGSVFRPRPTLEFRRERLELADGDFVDLGWVEGPRPADDGRAGGSAKSESLAMDGDDCTPLVLLIHGLTGGFESKYLRGTARLLRKAGLRAVMLQQRGAGPEPNRLPRTYHHGASADVREVIAELRRREPRARMGAIGWSLGANVLLKYLGEEAEHTPLEAAAAVCAPFRLEPCAERLRTGLSRLYQDKLLRALKDGLRLKYGRGAPLAPGPAGLPQGLAAADFFAWDDAITAPLHGFADARDYYARCESGRFLRHIRRPTLVLNAADDPFMTPAILPKPEELSPWVTVEIAERGGHVGFIAAGRYGQPQFWAEHHIAAHMKMQLLGEPARAVEPTLATE